MTSDYYRFSELYETLWNFTFGINFPKLYGTVVAVTLRTALQNSHFLEEPIALHLRDSELTLSGVPPVIEDAPVLLRTVCASRCCFLRRFINAFILTRPLRVTLVC